MMPNNLIKNNNLELTWECQKFSELTPEKLYKILQLRSEVFVVEQNCVFLDCDNKDFDAYHLSAWDNRKLVAYSRIIPIGLSYKNAASIGRVITSPSVRRLSIGKLLMKKSIDEIDHLFGKTPIKIGAQFYLKKFYESFSFVQEGAIYLEDGIEHITMERI